MKYIIMCGGTYPKWKTPRWFIEVNGERIIDRTIRLLKEIGIEDIAISSNLDIFNDINVPILRDDNNYVFTGDCKGSGAWINGFYPTNEEVCYLFGDVLFSPAAIKKIVETETEKIEFFASAPPFDKSYIKKWAEPFAFKVVNTKYFQHCINKAKDYAREGLFKRGPIAWELWQVIKGSMLNEIDYTNYTIINDYTCDIDCLADLKLFEQKIAKYGIIRNE